MDIEKLKKFREWMTAKSPQGMTNAETSEIVLELIDEAIARQSETEMVTCPDCGGSGVYQEYDEYDRYHVHACGKCDGSGEVDRQQESED